VVCDEIERDLAIRYETPRVCYHLMMGRTRDNPALRGGGHVYRSQRSPWTACSSSMTTCMPLRPRMST